MVRKREYTMGVSVAMPVLKKHRQYPCPWVSRRSPLALGSGHMSLAHMSFKDQFVIMKMIRPYRLTGILYQWDDSSYERRGSWQYHSRAHNLTKMTGTQQRVCNIAGDDRLTYHQYGLSTTLRRSSDSRRERMDCPIL